ncbi:DUF5333 domain-containing protein [Alisedimentitalea sp. MJ-SS2]|uniref:DUF5333 domain-containing protein n=1 Tax=Aliisedimentitalea sp. MJ-SS2 TaxID=3049795 RepID=UPI00290EAD3A|nr:DUF5333 domain-containing protein [Alisedimentitalea sp. MJ-SS2]MDU8929041.1 DUF5333 domain-containing protein [Alisedimentitalea sp. MJ-SS2]
MRIVIAAALGLGLATTALAKTPLRDVSAIDDNMLYVALALEVSDKCGTIDARKVKGLNFLWSLKRKANSLGYSDDEINAYRKSPDEKARMRSKGEAYVKSKGFNPKSSEGLCKFGQAEIAARSTIGGLLKAK